MPDLDAAIRAKLDGWLDDICGAWRNGCPVDGHAEPIKMRAALNAALDLHHQAYALVYDVPRDPSGGPRRELHPWCVCQEHDGMTGEERRPCETVRAVAKELGVEADGG